MIRIELDRIHLELLLLAGLLAAFAGVVFEPTMRYGVNVTPLVALGVVGMIGLLVLVHRRFTAGDRNRVRAMVWLALVGALLGATAAAAAGRAVQSMALAAAGVGAMFFAVGTQFSIVIESREAAARAAVEEILDDENVFVASERLRTNGTDTNGQSSDTETGFIAPSAESGSEDESDETDTPEATVSSFDTTDEREDETRATESDGENDGWSDDGRDIERTDDPGSESWARSTADDPGPIPVIRSITPSESSEE